MTIYTPSQAEKKPDKDCSDPEVVTEPLVESEDEKVVTLTAKALRVSYFQRNQRNFFLHTLITLMVLVILTCGAIGANILYRHLNKRVYAGRCGNVFFDKTYHDQSGMGLPDPMAFENRPEDHVEELITVSDIEMYEHLYTSQFDEVRENHVWHDFVRNYTVIVDNAWQICYLMKLNRTAVVPPRDLIDFVDKLLTGYYMPKADVIRENYVVITPPLTDVSSLGPKFMDNCGTYDTYWMDKFVPGVVKRSVESVEERIATYGMFSNKIDDQTLYKIIVHNAQKKV